MSLVFPPSPRGRRRLTSRFKQTKAHTRPRTSVRGAPRTVSAHGAACREADAHQRVEQHAGHGKKVGLVPSRDPGREGVRNEQVGDLGRAKGEG
jgi:hypothetical protein